MVFNQTTFNKISTLINSLQQDSKQIDKEIILPLNLDQNLYHQALHATRQYAIFLENQKNRFNLNLNTTRTESLDELKTQQIDVNLKIIATNQIIANTKDNDGFSIEAIVKEPPRIKDILDNLNNITKPLIHDQPQNFTIKNSQQQISDLTKKLDAVYQFLQTDNQKLADNAIKIAQKNASAKGKVNQELKGQINEQRSARIKQIEKYLLQKMKI